MTTSLQPDPNERAEKRRRVCSLLRPKDTAVWLTSPAAVSWYLEGARIHTSLAGPPIAGVLVGPQVEQVITHSNEADRLLEEELPAELEVRAVPWHTPLDTALSDAANIRVESELSVSLRSARASLLPAEKSRFEHLCAGTARVLTQLLSKVRPDMSELQVAAEVTAGVVELGADPLVVMVAGEERTHHRHPLVTNGLLGGRAMVVVCARRHGLIANLTRWVQTSTTSAKIRDAEERILLVESAFLRSTRLGRSLGEVLRLGAAAYALHGFHPEEWQNHHQGGAAGYAGRDPRALPDTPDTVQDQQTFAWNPSAPGVKVEDTVILEDGRIRPLTVDPEWPTVTVGGLRRPVALNL